MGDEPAVIRPLGEPGDLGWVVMSHGEIYAEEFGWDTSFEALVARIAADYAGDHDPGREAAWIAEIHNRRVGCVFCVAADDNATAKLRLLLVHPDGRGLGLGARLVDTCIMFARRAGYTRMVLWTNHPLQAAQRIYVQRGFTLTKEQAHHSFGVDLVGQTYDLDLRRTSDARSPAPAAAQLPAKPGRPEAPMRSEGAAGLDRGMTAEPAAVVEKLYAARANGDMDAFRALVSSGVVWREHAGQAGYAGVHHGVDAVVHGMLASAMEVTHGTFRVELERIVPHGPLVVALVRWSATRGGTAMEGREVAVYRIVGGRVVEAVFHLDDPEATDAFFAPHDAQ